MEKMKLPAVPELALIPIERRSLPEADHKQESRKIRSKRKERDSAARGLIAVTKERRRSQSMRSASGSTRTFIVTAYTSRKCTETRHL